MGERRKRKSLWDLEEEPSDFSGMRKCNSQTENDLNNLYHQELSASSDHSGQKSAHSIGEKQPIPTNEGYTESRHSNYLEGGEAKETNDGQRYAEISSPRVDDRHHAQRRDSPVRDHRGDHHRRGYSDKGHDRHFSQKSRASEISDRENIQEGASNDDEPLKSNDGPTTWDVPKKASGTVIKGDELRHTLDNETKSREASEQKQSGERPVSEATPRQPLIIDLSSGPHLSEIRGEAKGPTNHPRSEFEPSLTLNSHTNAEQSAPSVRVEASLSAEKIQSLPDTLGPTNSSNPNADRDEKGMRIFKNALIEFVKELLKPAWKDGRMSREDHKMVVKKVVDKVFGSIQSENAPNTKDKIDHYLSFSQPKITKLVEAYVQRCEKPDSGTAK